MPHTNRKKKNPANNPSISSKPKPSPTQHTKRQEIQDSEGWVHIIDTPRNGRGNGGSRKPGKEVWNTGDFDIDGHAYVERTLEELSDEVKFWREGWKRGDAVKRLRGIFEGREEAAEPATESDATPTESTIEGEEQTSNSVSIPESTSIEPSSEAAETNSSVPGPTPTPKNLTKPTPEPSTRKPLHRRKVDNILVLGLGSLQSARREGRKASATQLAALETIVKVLSSTQNLTSPIPITLQEPLFTPLDTTYLTSLTSPEATYTVLPTPQGFSTITPYTLIYAIHCYADIYQEILNTGIEPAVLVGTDIEMFDGRDVYVGLKGLVEGQGKGESKDGEERCEKVEFPREKGRFEFSDTWVYWWGEDKGEGDRKEGES